MLSLLSAAAVARVCMEDKDCNEGEACKITLPPRIARACVEREKFPVGGLCTNELAHCCPEGTTCEPWFWRFQTCKPVLGQCEKKPEICCMAFPTCKDGFKRDTEGECTEADLASGRCVKEAMCCKEITCVKKEPCTLSCGTEVASGWTGNDEGSNHCNKCRCEDGVLGCTKMMCPDKRPCPGKEKSCTLSCGTVVPHGWGGKGEGDNHCNSCGCNDGNLFCTLQACEKRPCPKSCTLSCGTVVPHGWGGKGEGDNHCNSCGCNDGSVICTQQFCTEKKPCPCNEFTEEAFCIAQEGVCYNAGQCRCGFFDQVQCLVAPCSVNSCPKGYTCRNNYCGGCNFQCVKEQ